ncbi:MAG: hypothetical protein LUF04_06590 [Bacteroides sp.]|nr:hypothetical protein [Bacteroides sp.]
MSTNSQKWNSKQNIEKYIVITCMSLACAGCLWWIFAPSATDKEKEALNTGLNVNVPDPLEDVIIENKKEAYERNVGSKKERNIYLP